MKINSDWNHLTVCPSCRNVPKRRKDCEECDGTGFIDERERALKRMKEEIK